MGIELKTTEKNGKKYVNLVLKDAAPNDTVEFQMRFDGGVVKSMPNRFKKKPDGSLEMEDRLLVGLIVLAIGTVVQNVEASLWLGWERTPEGQKLQDIVKGLKKDTKVKLTATLVKDNKGAWRTRWTPEFTAPPATPAKPAGEVAAFGGSFFEQPKQDNSAKYEQLVAVLVKKSVDGNGAKRMVPKDTVAAFLRETFAKANEVVSDEAINAIYVAYEKAMGQ